jgi:hypothetical protein
VVSAAGSLERKRRAIAGFFCRQLLLDCLVSEQLVRRKIKGKASACLLCLGVKTPSDLSA